jgi:predicted anti-sigma-YlaC factor YlaD
MDCGAYREAISARLDGEDLGLAAAAIEAHLAGCAECVSWAATAMAVTRAARVGVADAVPDLSGVILAAATLPPRQRTEAGMRAPSRVVSRIAAAPAAPVGVARLGLALVAVAQLLAAIPELLGTDPGASVHVAHEQGSWALALAVGLLVVALRPGRAAALLPVMAALVTGLAVTMALDISAGRTQAAAEAPHGLAFLGLGLLWLVSQQGPTIAGRRTPVATGRTGWAQ